MRLDGVFVQIARGGPVNTVGTQLALSTGWLAGNFTQGTIDQMPN